MIMILETRKFNVNTSQGRFGLYVSSHSDGVCLASVLWYNKSTKSDNPVDGSDFDFELKSFANTSQDAVYKEAVKWIKENFDTNAKIVAEEQ